MGRIDPLRVLTALAALAACAVGALALFAIPATDVPLTYHEASDAARVLGVLAGLAVIVAALIAARANLALLLLAMATSWFAQDLAALGDSGALLRSVATGVPPLAAALALHLALAFPAGGLSRSGRRAVVAAYSVAAACAIG